MDNHQKRQLLETQLRFAAKKDRRAILRELAALSGHRGADNRPAGEGSEKR
jgi:hypothetical protein